MLQHEPAVADKLYKQIFGDKELYWIACALSNTSFALTPFSFASVGVVVRCSECRPQQTDLLKEKSRCVKNYANALGQYIPDSHSPSEGQPRLSHINGYGVEMAMVLGPHWTS